MQLSSILLLGGGTLRPVDEGRHGTVALWERGLQGDMWACVRVAVVGPGGRAGAGKPTLVKGRLTTHDLSVAPITH